MSDWYRRAACRGMDMAIFFPENAHYADALAVCATCPVTRECLESVLPIENDLYGVFGGMTPKQREAVRWS